MKLSASSDTLVNITVDKQGLQIMINAAASAITYANEWNFGDEYDTDITPYHDLLNSLKQKYDQVYGNEC
jgi:hypothetical protein